MQHLPELRTSHVADRARWMVSTKQDWVRQWLRFVLLHLCGLSFQWWPVYMLRQTEKGCKCLASGEVMPLPEFHVENIAEADAAWQSDYQVLSKVTRDLVCCWCLLLMLRVASCLCKAQTQTTNLIMFWKKNGMPEVLTESRFLDEWFIASPMIVDENSTCIFMFILLSYTISDMMIGNPANRY